MPENGNESKLFIRFPEEQIYLECFKVWDTSINSHSDVDVVNDHTLMAIRKPTRESVKKNIHSVCMFLTHSWMNYSHST